MATPTLQPTAGARRSNSASIFSETWLPIGAKVRPRLMRGHAAMALALCVLPMLPSCGSSAGAGDGQGAPPQTVEAPSVTLIGANPQSIALGSAYVELGATASDDQDGDISASIVIDASAVDTATAGTYSVTYNVSDADGNAATARLRTVTIFPPSSLTFIVASNGTDGFELYRTDGTAMGTVMVKDINPNGSSSPEKFTWMNGLLFFTASDGSTSGRELWKSDGSEAGTVMVKDIKPGISSSHPDLLTVVGGTLFFRATDTVDVELWKSDGTEAGTVMVKNIDIGTGSSSNPSNLVEFNGALFFSARVAASTGRELWKSDGTSAGTVLVKDILPGTDDGGPSSLVSVNGDLFFSARDGVNGSELWKSDGTELGTVMVKDIRSGNSSYPGNLTALGNTLLFTARDNANGLEIWRSDGSEIGTQLVRDINIAGDSRPSGLTNVQGTVFFNAEASNSVSSELWKSDGTFGGTVLVKDINPTGGSSPSGLIALGSDVYFQANDGTFGRELWKSDGTEAGTRLVKDIHQTGNSEAEARTSFNSYMPIILPDGRLLFGADDGMQGREAWTTDGSISGTVLLDDVNVGAGHGFYMISN
ncbi:MAG: ELWxxDGT repeat protein [Chlamydiales bacterium]|jgi:ELWxxDGT repeat protein